MFWKIITGIYIIVTVFDTVFIYNLINQSKHIILNDYPELKTKEITCRYSLFTNLLRMIILIICPIVNVIMLITYVVRYDEIVDNIINSVEEKLNADN